ncbi:MAG: hypothetical protein IH597_07985, partial [Bacteroidales bacterium]|nr:hypothetical protein [Bacteroidales bacterium]
IKVSNGFDNPFKIEDIKVTGRPPTWSEVNELTLVKGTEQSFAPAMGISDDDKGKEYLFSGWIMNPSGRELIISIQNRKFPLALETPIDGWQRFEVVFTSPKVDFSIEIHAQVYYTPGNPSEPGVKPFYIDDIRLLPFNASMRTFVYDPAQHRTVAELDDNNYATFYNYDEEGTLVQVKKETERGIMTMRTTRQHITKYTE